MQNPELPSIKNYESIDTMYSYAAGKNIPWGDKEYKTPRQYLDPIDQIQQRKFTLEKKSGKDKNYVTKRGHYMDYDLKIAKQIPSAVVHSNSQSWNFQNEKKIAKFRKVDQKLIKHTFLEQIQLDQQKRKVPGICSYNLQKSLKEQQQQIEKLKKVKKIEEEKRFFHQDVNFLANQIPGSGNYSPHDEIMKIRKDKNDWKVWVQKHKKFDETFLQKDSIKPNSCSYSPMNMTLNTFERISISPKGKSKAPGFGSSARFNYQIAEKKKIKEVRPSPGDYKTMLQWKNKNESPKFKPWNTSVWKGKRFSSISVYNQ